MLRKEILLCPVFLTFLMVIWFSQNNLDIHFSTKYGYGNFKAWIDGAVTVLHPRITKNCNKIFGGDAEEVKRVNAETAKWKNSLSDQGFFEMTINCSWVQSYFSNNLYATKLEWSFPMAFSLLVHNSPQQVIRLLKVIYRPHNQYCIIPDSKSSPNFTGTFINIAACLRNVHISSKLISVEWGHHSIMDAQMICLKDLLDLRERQSKQKKWKYVINLCGKELPLATNHEIVSRLIKLNGSSAINPIRVQNDAESWSRLRGKIPFNLPYYKSSTYMGVSYNFAKFLFTNSTAIKVREFFTSCVMPEEHFYAGLSAIPGVPGGFNPYALTVYINYYIWQIRGIKIRCSGKIVHYLCIPKISDLRMIMNETKNGEEALFYNKYFMEYDHTLMDCMEEVLIARNKIEFDGDHQELIGASK